MVGICVNNKWYERNLTLGKEYEVKLFALYTAKELVRFIDDDGEIQYLYADRFEIKEGQND